MSLYIRTIECPLCRKEGNQDNTCKECKRENFDDGCFVSSENLCVDCKEKVQLRKRVEELETKLNFANKKVEDLDKEIEELKKSFNEVIGKKEATTGVGQANKLFNPNQEVYTGKIYEAVGLHWTENLGEMTWYEAMDKAKKLGMRLPTKDELKALWESGEKWAREGCHYWSSSSGVYATYYAWYVGFYGGYMYSYYKTYTYYVRCVSDGP